MNVMLGATTETECRRVAVRMQGCFDVHINRAKTILSILRSRSLFYRKVGFLQIDDGWPNWRRNWESRFELNCRRCLRLPPESAGTGIEGDPACAFRSRASFRSTSAYRPSMINLTRVFPSLAIADQQSRSAS